jgi:phytoene dehydrogenase-like protein
MHNLGTIGGWGYVIGGMGRVSWAIAEAAVDAGATLATGCEVVGIVPGEGVTLAGGEEVRVPVVVSNADPVRTLGLLDAAGADVDAGWRRRVEGWDVRSPVLKVNCGLRRLPTFPAAHGDPAAHRAMVVLSTGIDDTQAAFAAAGRGEIAPDWCELYFQTAYDPSVAPAGRHVMSVFAQYAPYQLASGTWGGRRQEALQRVLDRIARFAPDVADCVEYAEVLGPPDIEARVGLTGGHIFQGSCLPEQMWERRMAVRTPMAGLYLCGAATHPGGSVIGINGRNAAAAVVADSRGSVPG